MDPYFTNDGEDRLLVGDTEYPSGETLDSLVKGSKSAHSSRHEVGGDDEIKMTKSFSLKAISDTELLEAGDGLGNFAVPEEFDGWNLVNVGAHIYGASVSGNVSIQIHNATTDVDMLSTEITIEEGEKDSVTAVVQAVIDTGHDDVSEGDEIRIDVTASGTDVTGLEVRFSFRKP